MYFVSDGDIDWESRFTQCMSVQAHITQQIDFGKKSLRLTKTRRVPYETVWWHVEEDTSLAMDVKCVLFTPVLLIPTNLAVTISTTLLVSRSSLREIEASTCTPVSH